MTIFESADLIEATIELHRYPNQNRWTARFQDGEISSNGLLTSEYGNKDTMEGAIRDYIKRIAGRKIVINATSRESRRSYVVPATLEFGP